MKELTEEIKQLLARIRLGNDKLIAAWEQVKLMDGEQRKLELERWHQANEKLSMLEHKLRLLGFDDCMYLDEHGVKTRKCLENAIGCRVCPSITPYWEKELMSLPSASKEERIK